VRYNATDATDGGVNPGAVGMARQSALYDDGITSGRTLSVQGVQISFRSEFHTIGPFLKFLEEGERLARVKNVSVSRIQESELKGVVNLEYVSLSPDAERGYPGLYAAGAPGAGGGAKSSLFEKYAGYVEEGADPTILLLSEEEDIDPDFYMVIKASSSNETKVGYGVYPRVETEVRSNVNNAVRAKLTIEGDEEQFEYIYSLASQQKSERRKLGAEGGKLRMKILSCPRTGENDAVAVLLDVENNTALPLEITVVNDDVLNPRFHVGIVTANVSVANR